MCRLHDTVATKRSRMSIADIVITTVTVEREIRRFASIEDVWRKLTDFGNYSNIMENVLSVETDMDGVNHVSEWKIKIDDVPLVWKEKDVFDQENLKISFEAIGGDLQLFRGYWQIVTDNAAAKIMFIAEFSIGIPPIEKALGHILKEKMHSNIMQMMVALEREVGK